jgi:CubicO group peptidase (beta-lactamase class C family)
MLILIILLGTTVPALSATTNRVPQETVDQENIDAYIQSRMHVTHIPGLALGVVRGNQVVYLKGYGIAGPDGRGVTPIRIKLRKLVCVYDVVTTPIMTRGASQW